MSTFRLSNTQKYDGTNNSMSYAGLKTARFIRDNRNKLFLFNSKDRLNGSTSSSNSTIQAPEVIQNAKSITLEYFSIPNTIYNIGVEFNNNVFAGTQGGAFSVTIPDGNYDPNGLFNTLSALLLVATGNVWTFTLSSTTSLVTISSPVPFVINFTVNGSMWFELGFKQIFTTLGTSTTGISVIQLQGLTELFINIDNYESTLYSTSLSANFCIPVDVLFGDIIVYKRNIGMEQNSFFNLYNNKSNSFTFHLLDRNGQFVNLNGAEWSLLLSVTYYD